MTSGPSFAVLTGVRKKKVNRGLRGDAPSRAAAPLKAFAKWVAAP